MTLEERAESLAKHYGASLDADTRVWMAGAILSHLKAVRDEEREACARIADECSSDWREAYKRKSWGHFIPTAASAIAMKIRDRAKKVQP